MLVLWRDLLHLIQKVTRGIIQLTNWYCLLIRKKKEFVFWNIFLFSSNLPNFSFHWETLWLLQLCGKKRERSPGNIIIIHLIQYNICIIYYYNIIYYITMYLIYFELCEIMPVDWDISEILKLAWPGKKNY